MSDLISAAAAGHLISTDGGRGAIDGALDAEVRARIALRDQKVVTEDWRHRARVLSASVKARKMSEAALLEALQQENANHPLASREAIEKVSDEAFHLEISKMNRDPEAYSDEIVELFDAAGNREAAARRERIAPIEAPFLAAMPEEIRNMTEEQRAAKAKPGLFSFGKRPAWIEIEEARKAAVERFEAEYQAGAE